MSLGPNQVCRCVAFFAINARLTKWNSCRGITCAQAAKNSFDPKPHHCNSITNSSLFSVGGLMEKHIWPHCLKIVENDTSEPFTMAFSTNFCRIKTELSGNTVWPQASFFYAMLNETFSVIFKHRVWRANQRHTVYNLFPSKKSKSKRHFLMKKV